MESPITQRYVRTLQIDTKPNFIGSSAGVQEIPDITFSGRFEGSSLTSNPRK
jgi:hypothetical protein